MDIPNSQPEASPLTDMQEGDVLQFDAGANYRYDVLKVTGGWLYTLVHKTVEKGDIPISVVFVPKPFFAQQ